MISTWLKHHSMRRLQGCSNAYCFLACLEPMSSVRPARDGIAAFMRLGYHDLEAIIRCSLAVMMLIRVFSTATLAILPTQILSSTSLQVVSSTPSSPATRARPAGTTLPRGMLPSPSSASSLLTSCLVLFLRHPLSSRTYRSPTQGQRGLRQQLALSRAGVLPVPHDGRGRPVGLRARDREQVERDGRAAG